MQADKGLQFERTELAQRRTGLVTAVLMMASLRLAGAHGPALLLPLVLGTVVLAAVSLVVLRPGLAAIRQADNLARRFRVRNLCFA